MRNPWGKFEWNGDWGDNSDKWNLLSEEAKQQLGNHEAADDGTFWIDFRDMSQYFIRV